MVAAVCGKEAAAEASAFTVMAFFAAAFVAGFAVEATAFFVELASTPALHRMD